MNFDKDKVCSELKASNGMVLAIDHSQKRLGIAVSERSNILAKNLLTVYEKRFRDRISIIKKLCQDFNIKFIVLGYPLNMNGTKSRRCLAVDKFSENIKNEINIQILFWDERRTTQIAKKIVRKNKVDKIDEFAAAIFLQEFLDYINN